MSIADVEHIWAYAEGYNSRMRGEGYVNPYGPSRITIKAVDTSARADYANGYREADNLFNEVAAPTTVFREAPKVSRKGRMSDDRVMFFLRAAHLDCYKYATVLKNTFGLTQDNISKLMVIARSRAGQGVDEHGVRVVCRPSQFTRFLIRRNEAGKQNQFKELSPELFDAKEIPETRDVDVSRNPA